jgi:excisionase family DNA binding protein
MARGITETPEFYRSNDAIRIFGLTRTQLYQLMKDGRLPYRQLGRARLLARTDLEALLNDLPVQRGRNAEAA